HFTGSLGLADGLMEARKGQITVTIKSNEKLDYGNGKVEYKIRAEPAERANDQNASMDTSAMRLYALGPSLLPTKVSTHLNDLSLPPKIRDALYSFVRETDATSFATVKSTKAD